MAQRTVRLGRTEIPIRWTLLDRVIEAIAPVRAGQRLQARVGHAMMSGGYHGGSRTRKSLAGWNTRAQDADADTLADLPTLRARARDLDRNAPIAGGAVNTAVTNVVGTGLSCQPEIDAALLGLTEDAADAWQIDTLRKYLLWSESADCDITRHQSIYGLQSLAFRSTLNNGDLGVLLTRRTATSAASSPVRLALQLIEADRICNPDYKPDTDRLVAGIELDANGAPVKVHVASRHPTASRGRAIQWRTIDVFGGRSGRRNFLHLFERKRVGLTRGVPFIAPIIEPLKQLERYTEAELAAAVVSGMFAVFIETQGSASFTPSAQVSGTETKGLGAAPSFSNGLMTELNPGEKISSANPGRPNANFDPFVTAIIRQIGLLLEIPYEILVKHYQSSYSAAKAAMNDAWRFFRARRDWLADVFCQPVYEAWLEEAVAIGHVDAPGFFTDPLVRRAWCSASWVGDGQGSLDPLKEAKAARERVELTISTLDQESILHDGRPWRGKLAQRKREEVGRRDAGLGPTSVQSVQTLDTPPDSGQ